MIFRTLCIGDVVGRPGRKIIRDTLAAFRTEREVHFVVCNGENSASGSGLTPKTLSELTGWGADVVTSGDHIYKNRDVFGCLDNDKLLRPLNYPDTAFGKGWGIYDTEWGIRVGVINLIGQVFMNPADNAFVAVDRALAGPLAEADCIIVDMHAEATSEKIAMGWHLDGRVAAVVGTHTHVQTADERILPNGTAYLTDLGMTGAFASVLGRDIQPVLHAFRTQMPARFTVAERDVHLSGALISYNTETKRAIAIERISLPLVEENNASENACDSTPCAESVTPAELPSPTSH